jgi:hypothetical protein
MPGAMAEFWYRELNIMNRVSNKDFDAKSCNLSTQRSFSDVFHPASCMQSLDMPVVHLTVHMLLSVTASGTNGTCRSLTGNTMEEW